MPVLNRLVGSGGERGLVGGLRVLAAAVDAGRGAREDDVDLGLVTEAGFLRGDGDGGAADGERGGAHEVGGSGQGWGGEAEDGGGRGCEGEDQAAHRGGVSLWQAQAQVAHLQGWCLWPPRQLPGQQYAWPKTRVSQSHPQGRGMVTRRTGSGGSRRRRLEPGRRCRL
jgi:hypothetical protein